jgi:hypothetical protein
VSRKRRDPLEGGDAVLQLRDAVPLVREVPALLVAVCSRTARTIRSASVTGTRGGWVRQPYAHGTTGFNRKNANVAGLYSRGYRRAVAGGARDQWQWLCAADQTWPAGQLGRSPPSQFDIAAPNAIKTAISAKKTSGPLIPLVLRRRVALSSCCCFRFRFFRDIALAISRVRLLRCCYE